MPNYGEAAYWDDRYRDDEGSEGLNEPFDWLFSYADVKDILHSLLPDRNVPAMLIGCGNAPFSVDMHGDGYKKIVNSDYSTVVISQQRQKFPHMKWDLLDVFNSNIKTDSEPCIVDKSLIDTILCYANSLDKMKLYMHEMFRILKPGGRFVTFSLHPISEVIDHFDTNKFDWTVNAYNVKSPRWQKTAEARHKSVTHTMIVCDKRRGGLEDLSIFPPINEKLIFRSGALTDEVYQDLKEQQNAFNLEFALNKVSSKKLVRILDSALVNYQVETLGMNPELINVDGSGDDGEDEDEDQEEEKDGYALMKDPDNYVSSDDSIELESQEE